MKNQFYFAIYFIKDGFAAWEDHFSINMKASYTLDKDLSLYFIESFRKCTKKIDLIVLSRGLSTLLKNGSQNCISVDKRFLMLLWILILKH